MKLNPLSQLPQGQQWEVAMQYLEERIRQTLDGMSSEQFASECARAKRLGALRSCSTAGFVLGAWLALSRVTPRGARQAGRSVVISDHTSGEIERSLLQCNPGGVESLFQLLKVTRRQRLRAAVDVLRELCLVRQLEAVAARHEAPFWLSSVWFLAHFQLYRKLLTDLGPEWLLLVDDVSPERLALGMAAGGLQTQVGYLLMPGLRRPPPPFPVDVVFAQTAEQADEIGLRIPIAVREERPPPVRSVPKNRQLRVGVLTNAWSTEDNINELAREIFRARWDVSVHARTHPRHEVDRRAFSSQVELAGAEVTLGEFILSCDLVIGGQTTALEEARRLGVPCATVRGLDTRLGLPHSHDEQGRFLELRRPLQGDFIQAVFEFVPIQRRTESVPNRWRSWEELAGQILELVPRAP